LTTDSISQEVTIEIFGACAGAAASVVEPFPIEYAATLNVRKARAHLRAGLRAILADH
jgi:hypothetical protein